MASQLFRVDLSDSARDFQPTATEPGLAMLDRNGANHVILRRWLGDYVAEPEWQGQCVHFYVRQEERGRLDNVHCIPCTKADLFGPLKEDLAELDEKLRKSQAETSTEQLLRRIIRKQFDDLTRDYDSSDFHFHFFKYRQGKEPWRLLWCWGYQRGDLEPAKPIVCGSPECQALYARRPKQKARCPVCSSGAVRGSKPPASPLARVLTATALLLLLLLLGLFFFFNRPRLEVTPDDWAGPPGSRVNYTINHKRWFFFNDDITEMVVPQSHDKRVVEFAPYGAQAKARAQGRTPVTFRYKSMSVDATVRVGPPKQPKSIAIEPAEDVKLAIGSTKQLRLMGKYDDLDPVDLTELATWEVEKSDVAFAHQGKIEGAAEGVTKVTASYRATDEDDLLDATVNAVVTKVDYASIELAVQPESFGLGRGGKIEVFGVDKQGEKYSLLGSSLLNLEVLPVEVAEVEGDYLVGKKLGAAKLTASLNGLDLTQEAEFSVTDGTLLAGTFDVSPDKVTMLVDEYFDLDVIAASADEIKATSSDPEVVSVFDQRLTAHKPGKSTVTLVQNGSTETVEVTVNASEFATLRIFPENISLLLDRPEPIRVYGVTSNGQEIEISPERITWVKQPSIEYVHFDRDESVMFGTQVTPESQPLVAQLGDNEDVQGTAYVSVIASPLSTTVVDIGGDFLAHPPIDALGTRTVRIGDGAYYDDLVYRDGGVYVGDLDDDSIWRSYGVPPGAIIEGFGDVDLTGLSAAEVRRRLVDVSPLPGTVIRYREPNGALSRIKLGVTRPEFDVMPEDVTSENLTDSNFNALITVRLREAGEYRITDLGGEPLSEWNEYGRRSRVTIRTEAIPRTADDEYEVYVERRIGGRVKRYQVAFTLKQGNSGPPDPLDLP